MTVFSNHSAACSMSKEDYLAEERTAILSSLKVWRKVRSLGSEYIDRLIPEGAGEYTVEANACFFGVNVVWKNPRNVKSGVAGCPKVKKVVVQKGVLCQ